MKILPILLVIIFFVLSSSDLFALCSDLEDCCDGLLPPFLCTTCPDCPAIPIDGGLSALLVAGAAYGAKKVYGKSKE